jgi:coenzyme Q-binding protein COQ10
MLKTSKRTFFKYNNPLHGSIFISNKKTFEASRLVGYSAQQMYDLASNTQEYPLFVPFVLRAQQKQVAKSVCETERLVTLQIGFKQIKEEYTSRVILREGSSIFSTALTQSQLFKNLACQWHFKAEGSNSCLLGFWVEFEFKSILHAQLSSIFFEGTCQEMLKAFEARARVKYGRPSFESIKQ